MLDLNLPDIDGIEVCRRIRKSSDVPILMLTARDEDVDKIIGLEVGADDYLTKPFNPRELVARVKSVLRRSAPDRRRDEAREITPRRSRHQRRAARGARRRGEIQLAPKEFDLLWELLDHRGLVLTRDQLLERVWGYTFAGDTRTVDVHVRQIRRKLGDASPIVTVWGVGYKVAPEKSSSGDRLAAYPYWPCSGRCASASRRSFCSGSSLAGHRRRADLAAPVPGLHARHGADELRREAAGIAQLYAESGAQAADEGENAPVIRPRRSSRRRPATHSSTSGRRSFPGQDSGLERASRGGDRPTGAARFDGRSLSFEFTLPRRRRYLAAAEPLRLEPGCATVRRARRREAADASSRPVGAARAAARRSRSSSGSSVAGSLSWWLSRRITGPVLALSDAADEIAEGNYARPRRGRDRRRRDRVSSQSGSTRWRRGSPQSEEHERQFLM